MNNYSSLRCKKRLNFVPLNIYAMKYSLFIIVFFISYSCQKYPKDVIVALEQAGNNRSQLEYVLNKYYWKDRTKYLAACFLISNMPYHETLVEIKLDSCYYNYFKEMDSLYMKTTLKSIYVRDSKCDSIKKKLLCTFNNFDKPVTRYGMPDIKWISADFLIDNIEAAFLEWKTNPLLKELSFSDFKEAILPYRTTVEYLNFTKSDLRNKYVSILFEPEINDIRTIIGRYNNYIEGMRNMHREATPKDHLGIYDMYMSAFKRNCFNITTWSCNIFRSCGLPVYFEFTPQYRDRNTSHYWCASPDNSGIPLPFTVPDNNLMEDWESELQYSSKIYRRTFAANWNAPYFTSGENEEIPIELSSPSLLDVTWRYHKTITLRLPITAEENLNRNAYLCVFNSKKGFTAVGWGKIDDINKEVVFEQVPINQLFFPAYYIDGKYTLFSNPFIIQADSSVNIPHSFSCKYPYKSLDLRIENEQLVSVGMNSLDNQNIKYKEIKCDKGSQDLYLIRKYPAKRNLTKIYEKLKGAVVVGFNERTKYDTLFTLPFVPKPYMQDVNIQNKKAYKSYFFSVPNQRANIAELEFLSENIPNSMAVLPTPLPVFSTDTIKNKFKKAIGIPFKYGKNPWSAFDGDMESFAGGRLVGMEFSKPVCITHIRFAPRNANNMIVRGNRYELMYFDNKWKSAGIQLAKYNYLIFKNVPSNTIYWLKNLSNGKEELPFFYINGKQKFICEDLGVI